MHTDGDMVKVEWFEERPTHQVVPVAVGDEKMIGKALVNQELIAEAADAGTGIDNEGIPAFGDDFEAGCVATVSKIFRSADRNGSP